tara:strand:+ start:783 stop:1082 length:300 start_codon:yes stop_codon:yes gene_type:complete
MADNTDVKSVPEKEALKNPFLSMHVQPDSDLKDYIVQYVGTRFEKQEVTVEMIAETLAEEFPEFMYAIAEENFIRGYETGLDDVYNTFTEQTKETSREE